MTVETSRKEALAKGEKTYIGKVCSKDEDHGDERYSSSGSCVACTSERVIAARKDKPKKAVMSEGEVQALLLRGGPNSRDMAEMAGLGWFNGAGGCAMHGIVGVNGHCPLCGVITPGPDVKPELDLLS